MPRLRAILFDMVRDIWRTELSPEELLRIAQLMIHKGKKPAEDRDGYRPISITQAAYRLLALTLLGRLEKETKQYPGPSQAGAKKGMCTLHIP